MKTSNRNKVWLFFGAVYGITIIFVLPILYSGIGISSLINKILLILITFIPSTMGVWFVYLTRNARERGDFWRRVFRWPKKHTRTAIFWLLILPINVVIAFFLSTFLSGEAIDLGYALRALYDWKTLLVFLFVELVFGAISEELGWRGYALDELQSRWGALKSSLVLGLIWAFWHTPAFLIPGTSQYAMGGLISWSYLFFIVSVTMGCIIHTWAYNNTGNSILVAGILMHFTQNAALIFLGGIFDEFSLPAVYWPIQLLITTITASIIVLTSGAKNLRHQKRLIRTSY